MTEQESPISISRVKDPTIAALADYVFWSFNFSQGSQFFQDKIIDFGRNEHTKEIATLSVGAEKQIATQTYDRTVRYIYGPSHSDREKRIIAMDGPEGAAKTVRTVAKVQVADNVKRLLDPKITRIDDYFSSEVTSYLIANDHKYLVERLHGRPRKNPNPDYLLLDPFSSFVWDYGLFARKTPNLVIDKLFDLVRPGLIETCATSINTGTAVNKPCMRRDLSLLMEVTGSYLEHHPEREAQMEQVVPGIAGRVNQNRNERAE